MQDVKPIKFIFKGFLLHFDLMDEYMNAFKSVEEMDSYISLCISEKRYNDLAIKFVSEYDINMWFEICEILLTKL